MSRVLFLVTLCMLLLSGYLRLSAYTREPACSSTAVPVLQQSEVIPAGNGLFLMADRDLAVPQLNVSVFEKGEEDDLVFFKKLLQGAFYTRLTAVSVDLTRSSNTFSGHISPTAFSRCILFHTFRI